MNHLRQLTLLLLLLVLPVSIISAQDKQTDSQREAVNELLSAGSETVSAGTLLQSQDFEGRNEWDDYSDEDISMETADGVYRMTSAGGFYTWGLDNSESHADVVIEVDVSQLSKGETGYYGVMCRANPENNGEGYYFYVTGDGFAGIFLGGEGTLDTLVDLEETSAVNRGRSDNQMTAVCIGDYLALYVNGELAAETNDSTFDEGLIGVSVGAFEGGQIDAIFDNVRVWQAEFGSAGTNTDGGLSTGLTNPNKDPNKDPDNTNITETTNTVVSLTAINGDPDDTIAELESFGLIPSGSSFIFGEDYAFFTGQGAWFTPLARNKPAANIVIGGELTFQVGAPGELELCSLTSRIQMRPNSNTAETWVDVGFLNDGTVALLDFFSTSEEPTVYVGLQTYDLRQPHHVLLVLVDDRASVFVDGELTIENVEIVDRAGTYGISLLGKGAGSRCEGRNIFAYQVPSANPGECVVNAGRNVNKRSGPGTNFDSPGQLPAGQDALVIGRATGADGFTWWQLEDGSWVREDVVSAVGDCADVPTVKV